MRFNGYAKPAKQHLLGLQDCKVGDACLQVPDALQHERGRQVAAGQASKTRSGCSGRSVFPEILTYLSYNDVFELPTFHAGLYGLVKAFVGMRMSDYQGECSQHVIPRTKRSIMRERGKKIRLTAEFGRP
ncbi:TPA: hypothetical protein ACH3X1_000686 [Trebouxia sp. C0004]